jgi:acetylornithine deacetylase
MSVTVIDTENKQHNVVPAQCKYVIDVRVNELYSFEEILEALKENLKSSFKPRTTRMKSTSIPLDHALVKSCIRLGKLLAPTVDKARCLSALVGPGDSARSHTADGIFISRDQ